MPVSKRKCDDYEIAETTAEMPPSKRKRVNETPEMEIWLTVPIRVLVLLIRVPVTVSLFVLNIPNADPNPNPNPNLFEYRIGAISETKVSGATKHQDTTQKCESPGDSNAHN